MQHFYDLERAADVGDGFEFNPDPLRGYVEPTEFTSLAERATGKMAKRVRLIRSIPMPARRGDE